MACPTPASLPSMHRLMPVLLRWLAAGLMAMVAAPAGAQSKGPLPATTGTPAPLTPTSPPSPAAPGAAAPSLDTPEAIAAAYDNAVNAFKYQDFDAAVPQLRALLYPKIRLDFRRELLVREYLGSSLWWQGKREEALDEFTALLVKKPQVKLDPAQYPPKMVADFESRRKRLQETGVIRDTDAVPLPDQSVRLRARPALPLAFLPFGAGQFANGQTTKGWVFLTAEAALAGLSAGMYLANVQSGQQGPRPLRDDVIQIGAGSAFWLLAGIGIWDALANRPPQRAPGRATP